MSNWTQRCRESRGPAMGGAHASSLFTYFFPNTDRKESLQIPFNNMVRHQRSLVLSHISKKNTNFLQKRWLSSQSFPHRRVCQPGLVHIFSTYFPPRNVTQVSLACPLLGGTQDDSSAVGSPQWAQGHMGEGWLWVKERLHLQLTRFHPILPMSMLWTP